ncbi:MAG: phage terminase large subunit [Halobacteriota archaeon]
MTMIDHTLARDLARSLDPVLLAQQLGIAPDPWQRTLLRCREKQIILNCSRQSGKSTTVAILALWHALTTPNALVLILSPSHRQSSELFKKVVAFYRELNRPIKAENETTLTLELANKARIVSLPGKEQTVRGFSGASLLLIDEASRVPDELYVAVRPMLAVSQGRIILLSTPWGQRGFFYETWIKGGSDWQHFEVKATDCPRISKAFLRQERETVGPYWFEQEYMCVFGENQASVFHRSDIERAFAEDVDVWEFDIPIDTQDLSSGSPEDFEQW